MLSTHQSKGWTPVQTCVENTALLSSIMSFRDPGWPRPCRLKPKAFGALECRSHRWKEEGREGGRVRCGWLWVSPLLTCLGPGLGHVATSRVGAGLIRSLVPKGTGCFSPQESPALGVALLCGICRNAPCTPWLPTPSPKASGLRMSWQWPQRCWASMKRCVQG